MSVNIHVPLADRGVVSVSGEDAQGFLQGLITNDIEKVSETTAIYAALLTPQGKFLFDFFIVEYKDRLLLDCEAARIPYLVKRLTMYRLRAKVEIAGESNAFSVGRCSTENRKLQEKRRCKDPVRWRVLYRSATRGRGRMIA